MDETNAAQLLFSYYQLKREKQQGA
uniref:Uncharacterized protein n=1 Tax=Anguilla anguilla TaxID=7936 RepID=A0A0E9P5M9_ANGAN